MSEALDKLETINRQLGYEQGQRSIVTALYVLMSEAAERGERAIPIDTLANVLTRELRR